MLAVGVAAIGVGVTAVLLQQQDNRALRREVAALRDELRTSAVRPPAASPRVAPAPVPEVAAQAPAALGAELAKLREEIAAMRKGTDALGKFAAMAQAAQSLKALEKAGDAAANQMVPVNQWKNAGKASPEAASETALWAAVGGDVDLLAGSLAFTESSRAKADAWFAGLSEGVKQQYGSPEKVIALMIARDAAALTGMQVLARKEVTADDVGLRIRLEADGRSKDDTFLMHRAADGWKMMLPDQAVESFARKLSGKR